MSTQVIIATPFITGTDDTRRYFVVATTKGVRRMISGPHSIYTAQEKALSLKGDPSYSRPTYVPYPYKPKKAKK